MSRIPPVVFSRIAARSITRLTQLVAFLAVVSFACLLSCSKGSEPSSPAGTWTGYLEFGGSTSGYNTMTFADDLSCTLVGEISGQYGQWEGSYRLRFEGDLNYYSNSVLSTSILITRYRPGLDTMVSTGTWSGDVHLDSGSAWGIWMTRSDGPFPCNGTWMAARQ